MIHSINIGNFVKNKVEYYLFEANRTYLQKNENIILI